MGALVDVRAEWLRVLAEYVRGDAGLSLISLRALWLVRVWCAGVGAWCVWIEFARRRAWSVPAGPPVPLGVWPAAVAVGLLAWTLPLGFLGDDFLWLEAWAQDGAAVVRPEPGAPHYIPLGLLLCNVPHALFGMTPLPYRLVTVALHAGAAWVVAQGALASGLRPGLAVGAGMVFASTALAYEPLLWATGQFYLWAGLLTAVVLAAILRGADRLSVPAAWGVGVGAAAAGFIIEQAAGLTLFVLLWAAVGGGRRCERAVRAPLLALPMAGAIILVLLRAGTRSPADALASGEQVARTLNQVLGGMLLANSPAGHMLGGWVGTHAVLRVFGAAVTAAAVAFLWRRSGQVGRTLLSAWVVLWLPALLFAPQSSRYWYLPAVPASIGGMHLLGAFEAWLEPAARGGTWPVGAGAVAVWVLLGAVAMGLRVPDWREANALARAVERDVALAVTQQPHTRRVVVAGAPDGVGTDLWPAYVFNNGLAAATRRLLRRDGTAWDGAVEMLDGPQRPWPGAYTAAGGPPWPAAALAAAGAAPDTVVLVYDRERRGLTAWGDARE